jgi:hypothetical protein
MKRLYLNEKHKLGSLSEGLVRRKKHQSTESSFNTFSNLKEIESSENSLGAKQEL